MQQILLVLSLFLVYECVSWFACFFVMFGFIFYQRLSKAETTYKSNELYDKLLVYKKPKKIKIKINKKNNDNNNDNNKRTHDKWIFFYIQE